MIIGFDSEFKTPDYSLSNFEIKEGLGKYEVLSYQFHSRSYEGVEWCGILIPEKGERITLTGSAVDADSCLHRIGYPITRFAVSDRDNQPSGVCCYRHILVPE